MESSNKNIRRSLDLAEKLIMLAGDGEAECRDDGCILLFGIVRDCGYRIRSEAQRERREHESRGLWSDPNSGCGSPSNEGT